MTTVPLNGVQPRAILVTHCEPEKSGARNGKPWTLYKILATELNGTPITDELRCFDPMPVGEVTVTQKAFVKDEKIQHYTLEDINRPRVRRAKNAPPSPVLGECCDGCEALERRVTALERRLNAFLANPEA
jgi:siroheme synthase